MPHATSLGQFIALLAVVLFAIPQSAAQEQPVVPEQLKPWIPWVKAQTPQRTCPVRQNVFVCDWPSSLNVVASKTQGTFSMNVWLDAPTTVSLPGGDTHWPQDVLVDGKPALVIKQASKGAVVQIEAGSHVLSGALRWKSMPQFISVPTSIALVSLKLNGVDVEQPRLDAQGRLWVQEDTRTAKSTQTDTLRVSVYRRLADGVPMNVDTMLELNVSGRAREVELGDVLLDASRPYQVSSALPVQVSPQGSVKVYVRPGTHTLTIKSVITTQVKALTIPKLDATIFDPQEYWAWYANDKVRAVNLTGLQSIDASRTTLPPQWRTATSTRTGKQGESLNFDVTRRGIEGTSPNLLNLTREVWLDLDGDGYTFKDTISGKLQDGWRLDFSKEGVLGRVHKVNGSEDLLITQLKGSDPTPGVEIREQSVTLKAEGRYEKDRGDLPAVGWNHNVQSLGWTLKLPPGWSVLATQGVDVMPNTWIDSWSLFEFFILLILSFAMGKMFGWPWAIVSLIAMIASHGHSDAPRYVWFSLLAASALLRVLPAERVWFRRATIAYLIATGVVFVAVFGAFTQGQIKYAMFPQVQPSHTRAFQDASPISVGSFAGGAKKSISSMKPGSVMRSQDIAEEINAPVLSNKFGSKLGNSRSTSNWMTNSYVQQVAPNEVVQTGPGLPSWTWQSWRMGWNGPVSSTHRVKLFLVSPTINFIVRFASVLLFLLMMLVFINPKRFSWRPKTKTAYVPWHHLKRLVTPALLLVCVASPLALNTSDAHAQAIPSEAMLNELKTRLSTPHPCLEKNNCLVVPSMTMNVDGQKVSIRAEIHAQVPSTWTLPGPIQVLRPTSVMLDGNAPARLRRETNQMLRVRIPQGRHVLEIRGVFAEGQVTTLQFEEPSKPEFVEVFATGWSVDGLKDGGRIENSLQFSSTKRTKEDPAEKTSTEGQQLPPWFYVERVVSLSLPWTTTTTVSRVESTRPTLIKIPLLEGESVITEGVIVEKGMAQVYFPRGAKEVKYSSELKQRDQIKLTASVEKPWTETWIMECTRIWRCTYDGLNPVQKANLVGIFDPQWMPWAGESLTLTINRPEASPGSGLTVDKVLYEVTPGKRLSKATLNMTLRASQGTWQKITLPPNSEVQQVLIDDVAKSLQPKDGVLDLPVKPGKQTVIVMWQMPNDATMFQSAPPVDLGVSAANVRVRIKLPQDKWLLWTTGPQWGPAVLFWMHLVWMTLLALLLGRLTMLPVRTYEWMLLALGMAQLPILAMVPLVGWFILIHMRRTQPSNHWAAFNIIQLSILGLTLVCLVTLYGALHTNLLSQIDMQVQGMQSSNSVLNWYTDHVTSKTPKAGILMVPVLVWRATMLIWALWLVSRLAKWVPWGWRSWSLERFYMAPPRPSMYPDVDGDVPNHLPAAAQHVVDSANGEVSPTTPPASEVANPSDEDGDTPEASSSSEEDTPES